MEKYILPDLYSDSGTIQEQNPLWLRLLKDKKLKGSLSDMMYEIGTKNIKAETQLGDAVIKAMLGYDGNMMLNASAPMLGGNIDFNANRANGINNFYLQYKRPF